MSQDIAPQSRVTHLADRNRSSKRLGTVEQVWYSPGTRIWYARVQWDNETPAATHPIDNLLRATT